MMKSLFQLFAVFSCSVLLLWNHIDAKSTTTPSEGACEDDDAPTVQALLERSPNDIVSFLGSIYEHSPWVAQEFVEKNMEEGPSSSLEITTVTQLAEALKQIVDQASYELKLSLLKSHPDLGHEAPTELTPESQQEQKKSGLSDMTAGELATFHELHNAYKEKFPFPFILAVRNASKHTILSALRGRLPQPMETEFVQAITQVHKIAWMRLLTKLDTSNAQGFLTCHVLDTANGIPASNMRIELHRLSPTVAFVGEYVTNDDGRITGGALRGGAEFLVGEYQWIFHVGDYYASVGTFSSGQPFLNTIPLRFGIDNP